MSDAAERQERLRDVFGGADDETKQVVLKVFQKESEKLHMGLPHGIVDELVEAIKQIVR